MRKLFSFLLLLVFVFSLAGPSFSAKKKTAVKKTKVTATKKKSRAKGAKPVFPVYKGTKAPTAVVAPPAAPPSPPPAVAPAPAPAPVVQKAPGKSGFLAGAGYGGGALIAGAGYSLPVMENLNVVLDAGYGIGNKYSVINAGAAGVFPIGGNYVGLWLGMVNYSEKVADLPGISGTIDKGGKIGLGVFAGMPVSYLQAQIGYNTALGLTAGAVYKF